MEHKSNSYKVNRQQREKVLRFSIRKYSFGAASVAVAALMFLGARVVSADGVSETNAQSTVSVVNPKEKDKSPVDTKEIAENKVAATNNSIENKETAIAVNSATTVDKTKLRKVVEELNSLLSTKLNLDESVVSPVKDRLQKGKEAIESSELAQKDIDELVELLSKDVTVVSAASKESTEVQVDKAEKRADNLASASSPEVRASEENQTVSDKKDSLKVSVDQLQAAVLELPEHETSKEVLEQANELLGLAQGVLENTTVSLNEVEEMTKRVKRMFNSVKIATLRLTSGSHDPRNGNKMEAGSSLRSAPIDKTTKQGSLGIVVADSGFITGYATPSSTIEIKKNGQKILTSKLDDTGSFKLNAPGIKVGDRVELFVNGQSVSNTTVKQTDTVSFNDSLAGVAQVDGYTAAEADVEVSIGGRKYTTRSQSNGYFTVNVDTNLMVKDATITAVVKKNGKEVGRGTSNVRETRTTDFGVGWNRNPMLNYSDRDIFSPDTKQYAFVSNGTADLAYDVVRVYREERIEKDGNKYYYWILDSGPGEVAKPGISKKISLAIPRTVGNPYDFTYTKYKDGKQISHEEHPSASAWEYKHPNSRAYAQNGVRRSGAVDPDNIMSYLDYINPGSGKRRNIYRDDRKDGTDRDKDAASRIDNMLVINKDKKNYFLMRGVIEDQFNIVAGQRSIITFKTKILEGDELDQSIMSDWVDKDKKNPMLDDIKKRLANDPYLAFGGTNKPAFWERFARGNSAIIGTLSLKPEEAARYNLKPKAKEQSTKVGVIPDAYNSIANPNELPAGTTYRWFKDPDVSRPTAPNQPVYGKVEVTIPERGKFIVDAPVHVVDDKAQTPVATAKDNGDVTAKPQNPTKVDKIKVSFTGEDNKQKTAEGTKGTNGRWTVNNPDVRIDANTGEITIPANKVKDLTEVTAVTKNGNAADSDPAKAIAKDVTGPTITANGATVTKNEPITPIPVTAVDNTGVTGMRPNNPIEVSGLPQGLTFTNGKITGTPTGPVGNSTVTIKAYDKSGNKTEKTITITVKDQASKYNPTGDSLTVNQGQPITDDAVKAKVKNFAPGSLTVVSKPSTAKAGNVGNAVVKVTYPDGSSDTVNVPVTVLEAPDNQPPTLAISPAKQTVVEGETVTFTVTARDNKIVNLDNSDFLSKYGSRLLNAKATAVNVKDTDTEKIRTITITTTAEDVGKNNTITFNATDNANHRATPVSFTFTVTSRDKIAPTITANNATVTSREQITPIPVTAEDNRGGVGMRQNNPIEVTGLPSGLTYANNRITGTPTGAPGNSTVTIKAYDKNGNKAEKTITITVRSQADVHNPTGAGLTVNQGHVITDNEVTAKVTNFGPGKLTVQSKPASTATAGSAGNAVVKVTYPDGSHDTVKVPVTVRDVTGPTITAEETTVTKNEEITPIPITAVDNTGGVGMRDTNPITVSNLPSGLTYSNGKITGTTSARKGFYTLTITAYDKNNTPSTKKVRINVQEQADKYTPTATELTVNQNEDITIEKLTPKVSNYGSGTLSLVSKPSTTTAGSAGNAVVKVTYSDGSHDLVNVPVTVKDVTGPTITANNATVTNREDITPISVTAKDNTGGVGMRDKNPIVVTGLPAGLTYANGKITGKPTGTAGESTVTITAYDKNDNPSTTTIKITVQSQADAHNPRGERLTVDQNHVIEDSEVIAKVKDHAPATHLTVKSKPTTAVVGNAEDAVVTVTYPDGSSEDVRVPVTVRDASVPDTEGPTITADGATVTKNEPIKPILVTAEDNPGGVGLRDDNPIVVDGLPNGLTFTDGKITGTPTGPVGDSTVTITAFDKKGNSTTTTITIKVQEQKDKYTPKSEGLTVNQGHEITDDEVKAKVKDFAPGTLTVTSKPSTAKTGTVGNAVVTVTYPDGSSVTVDVPVTVKDVTGPTIKADGATVTRNEPITPIPVTVADNEGGRGLREDTPVEVTGLPDGLTYANGEITGTPAKTAEKGGYTVTIKATDKDGNSTEKQITITVQTQADKYTPTGDGLKVDQGHTITDNEVTGKVKDNRPGTLTVTSTPSTSTFGDAGNAIVKVTYPDGSTDEVKVPVTVSDVTGPTVTAEGATVTKNEPIKPIKVTVTDNEGGRGLREENPVEVTGLPDGLTYANGEITGTPTGNKGDYPVTIKAYDKDGNSTTTNITIKVQEQADKYNPKYDDGNGIPGTKVEIPLKEEAGKTIPEGTQFHSNTPGITVDKDGKVTVTIPEGAKPGDKITGEIVVTYPDGSTDTVPVEVTVTNQDKDIYTPEYDKENGKPGTKVEIPLKEEAGKTIPEGTQFHSNTPGITVDKDGKVTVTIPEGAKPGDKITGEIVVTYPDGSTDTVPVEVTVTNQDKDIYTPEYDKENGKPGTKVEIPLKEEAGKTIPEGTQFHSNTPGITVDKDGKVTVTIPEGAKPGDKITGEIVVTYPDGSTDTVPVEVTVTNQDKDIYTPEYDKENGKPGTKVEIPVTSDTNGNSGQDTPAPTTPIPDAVTPNAEQVDPQTTIDNGAKSNDSQNVLPNTGTESNAALASLGLLGLLSGFGLVARKKKED